MLLLFLRRFSLMMASFFDECRYVECHEKLELTPNHYKGAQGEHSVCLRGAVEISIAKIYWMQSYEEWGGDKHPQFLSHALTRRGIRGVVWVQDLNCPAVNCDVLAGDHKYHEGEDCGQQIHMLMLKHVFYSSLEPKEDDAHEYLCWDNPGFAPPERFWIV